MVAYVVTITRPNRQQTGSRSACVQKMADVAYSASWVFRLCLKVAGGATVSLVVVMFLVKKLLQAMHDSVGSARPTADQLAQENHANHALFRHLPSLRTRLPWRELGDFPTPVHRGRVQTDKGEVGMFVFCVCIYGIYIYIYIYIYI